MDIYIARQPIFDRKKRIIAYELLFRKNSNNVFESTEEIDYTRQLLSNAMTVGFNTLVGEKRAFINFTRENLLSNIALSLPNDRFIIEVLEDVEFDDLVIEKCKMLKRKGYTIAIDDFVFNKDITCIIDYLDIIKVDFLLNSKEERKKLVEKYKNKNKLLLAEKIEDMEMYQEALEQGYDYFQGFFFSKPSIIKDYDIAADRMKYSLIINELNKENIDLDSVKEILRSDIGLSYKLLRYINTSKETQKDINSIDESIDILGVNEISKWLYLLSISEIDEMESEEVRENIALKAKFCENIALKSNMKYANEAFLVGLLSTLDNIAMKDMEQLLNNIPIKKNMKQTLLGEQTYLTDILNLAINYEHGNEINVRKLCNKCNVEYKDLSKAYINSLRWLEEFRKKDKNYK